MGSPLDKLLIIAVLTSASASTQTTILPTARTRSRWRPRRHPEAVCGHPPPVPDAIDSTVSMGVPSITWYAG